MPTNFFRKKGSFNSIELMMRAITGNGKICKLSFMLRRELNDNNLVQRNYFFSYFLKKKFPPKMKEKTISLPQRPAPDEDSSTEDLIQFEVTGIPSDQFKCESLATISPMCFSIVYL